MRHLSILAGVLCVFLFAAAPSRAADILPGDLEGDPTIHLKDADGNRITINYGDVNHGVISITAVINGSHWYEPNVTFYIPPGEKLIIHPDGSIELTPGDVLIGDPAYPENLYRLKIGDNGREVLAFPSGAQNALTMVPEPAVWAVLLAGFAGLGAMLRRRRGLAAA